MSKSQDWFTALQYAKYAAHKHQTQIYLVKVKNETDRNKCWKICRLHELRNEEGELIDINVKKIVNPDKTVQEYEEYKQEVYEKENRDLIEDSEEVSENEE